jgi:hypothetical protein
MRNREVCSADNTPVDPTNIIPSQIKTGSQYLRKLEKFIAVTEGVSPVIVKSAAGTVAATVLEIAA